MTLRYKVFLHSYLGFYSTSTLLYGERDAILIELNPTYADMAKQRLQKDRGGLLDMMEPSP